MCTCTGPEEPVRLLRFWPDQYFKLQQYFFKKTRKNTYRNVDLYRYRSSRAGAVKRHFDGYLLIKSLRYSGYYVTCKMVERRSEQEFSLARCTRATWKRMVLVTRLPFLFNRKGSLVTRTITTLPVDLLD